MHRFLRSMFLIACAVSFPLAASAGWVIEWQNTAKRKDGEILTNESATMYVSKNRVRVEQPTMVTIVDYDKNEYTILNPQGQLFWSGKVDEYIEEMVRSRVEAMRSRMGDKAGAYGRRKIDEASLPRIVIERTEDAQKIAERDTVKYTVKSNDELFQELWVAEGLAVSKDLDPKKVLAYEIKMGAAKLGKSADSSNALYRSADYRKLLEKGFVLRSVLWHIIGSYEQKALSARQADVEASRFEVPESYRRVRLGDVMPRPPQPQAGSTPGR